MSTWAFVDRRDGDSDELIGSFEQVEYPEIDPSADREQAREFRQVRIGRGVSLGIVAQHLDWTVSDVSDVERCLTAPESEQWDELWYAIGGR